MSPERARKVAWFFWRIAAGDAIILGLHELDILNALASALCAGLVVVASYFIADGF